MTKVMLVEDDNNLREIYDARLAAEGYETVSAHDGEEALALAVKEKPDLIISDVMMPKVSGFDMLDILRSTPETRDTKVIMMTALSQAEDRERAGKLGADRYLVKSQVTLEDVINVTHEVLGDSPASAPAPAAVPVSTPAADVQPAPTAAPTEPPTTPAPDPTPAAAAPTPEPTTAAPDPTPAPTPEPASAPQPTGISGSSDDVDSPSPMAPAPDPTPAPVVDPQPPTVTTTSTATSIPITVPEDSAPQAQDQPTVTNVTAPSHQKLVLEPTEQALSPKVDLDALAAKEAAEEANGQPPAANSVISPSSSSSSDVTPDQNQDSSPTAPTAEDPNQVAL